MGYEIRGGITRRGRGTPFSCLLLPRCPGEPPQWSMRYKGRNLGMLAPFQLPDPVQRRGDPGPPPRIRWEAGNVLGKGMGKGWGQLN